MDDMMSQFLEVFFEESFEGLDVMETALLELDSGDADLETINTIFRAAHSIKGGSATFGLGEVSEFTHLVETLLDEMRDGSRPVTAEAVNLLLQSVDCLREMLNASRDGGEPDRQRIEQLGRELHMLRDGDGGDGAGIPREEGETAAGEGEGCGWRIQFRPHANLFQTGNDPVRILRELADLGEMEVTADLSALPEFALMDPESSYCAWQITLRGPASREQIGEIFAWVEDDCDLGIEPLAAEVDEPEAAGVDQEGVEAEKSPPAIESPTDTEPAGSGTTPAAKPATRRARAGGEASSIRVGIDKVDDIINLVGELVITQSMLGQVGDRLEEGEEADSLLEKLFAGLAQLERNTRELQESVMRIRMLPISFVFNRFPRMVHDLSNKLGKQVELILSGDKTELDKTVMEKIGDPLVHLVRNAIDHGIEMPEERERAGKSPVGRVELNAYHKGGNIIIEISDDGKGLDAGKLLAKAWEKGLLPEGETLPDEKAYELIFHPGFSTAEEVSDVSGRGVGMDVVRKNINSLGGAVEIESQPGKGTRLTIRLPLTLSILDGQLVRVGEQTYVLPLTAIIESLEIDRRNVKAISGQMELYRLRDEFIPIIRLYELFGIEPDNTRLDEGLLVIVEGDGQHLGLLVDDLMAQQQVVIKSLEVNFKKVEGFSGATILGDGTVALILDISGLIKLARARAASMPGEAA